MSQEPAVQTVELRDNPYVLEGRQLRWSALLADTSRFDDDVWSLSAAALQSNARNQRLNFGAVPRKHRLVLKLVCLTALSGRLPPDEDRPKIQTIISAYYGLRHFLSWLSAEHAELEVSGVTPKTLESYQHYLLADVPSTWQRHKLRTGVAWLWRYRDSLGELALKFDPRTTDYWLAEPYPKSGADNLTPRIPDSVHAPLLLWSMRFVDDFSDDILSAADQWMRQKGETSCGDGPNERKAIPWGHGPAIVRSYLGAAREAGRPLPGRDGKVNFAALGRAIGCSRDVLVPLTAEICDLANELGVSEYAALKLNIRGTIDDQPWIEGFRLDPRHPDSLASLSNKLQTACYIVIAFLSGMRDMEVKHLKRGCCAAERSTGGQTVRWRVHSLAFKGERDEHGVPATWIVGAPAARAIAVLERLAKHADPNGEWLFAPLRTGPGRGSGSRHGNETLTVSATILALNRFVTWVRRYCDERNRDDGIPDFNGRPWHLTSQQFRRTLAWYIARRPGGSIAGAIAYRHQSIQMFEGYAGTADSGFRAEVEAEQALARGEHLLAMIEQHEHLDLQGPSATEAYSRLRTMGANDTFAGTVQTDPKRFIRLLQMRGPEVYPGKYVTCVFDRAKALCHASAHGPELGACKPFNCQNVALTSDNIETWRRELTQLASDMDQRPALPPALLARLEERKKQIEQLLSSGAGSDETN